MAPKFDFSKGFGELDKYLLTRSYIEGYSFSNADKAIFTAVPGVPDKAHFPHAYRWYIHVAALSGIRSVVAAGKAAAPAPAAKGKAPPAKKADDDDDGDLFGDDDEEATPAPALSRAEQIAKMKADKEAKEKANKKKDRTQIVWEVKPWEADQDLDALFQKITAIDINGLVWGEGYNKVPVAFGIFKLVISCVVNDDDVAVDDITDAISALEDDVQSVDMCTMSKI